MYESSADGNLFAMWPVVAVLAVYLYFAYAMFKIAQKAGHGSQAWWAFVPILNTLLLCRTARRPDWWFLLTLIPFINIIFFAILWIDTAKAVGHSPFLGFLTWIPILNIFTIGILAFSAGPGRPSVPQRPQQPTPRQPVGV